jgi:caffeoyl-CoA O-methyltransferase
MGPAGFLDTCELSPRNAEVAKVSFEKAGVGERVRIHLGPALDTLGRLEAEAPFDLVFIDADKEGYPAYLAWAEEHLRLGGVLLADNTFGFGHVHEERPDRESAAAMAALRAFSVRLAQGGRFRATMLPTAEGLSLGVKTN